MNSRKSFAFIIILTALACFSLVYADEGMWLLNNLPIKLIKQKYGFDITEQWIEKVQKSLARLPNCSASFVSEDGQVMTNGHCAEEAVQALSTAENNLYENGFYAKRQSDELKTGLSLRVLMSTENITDSSVSVQSLAEDKRRNFNLYCEPTVLYQGAQTHLYCYKIYDDVRLVFSSEKNVWFLGGDADNFEYPRYTLDVAFLRAYENGKPAVTPNHFDWSKSGAKEGELIFVSGHPGSTQRLLTTSALKTERDFRVPFLLDLFRRHELTTQQFMIRGREQARIAESDLFSWQNSRKLYVGKIRGLQDPRLIDRRKFFEEDILKNPSYASLHNQFREGLKLVEEAQPTIRDLYPKMLLMVRGLGFDTKLYEYAVSIALGNKDLASELLEERKAQAPLNMAYEEAKLRDSLTHLFEYLGPEDSLVKDLLAQFGNGPSDIAHRLIYKTMLSNISEHARLIATFVNGSASTDPMIRLAVLVKSRVGNYDILWNEAKKKEQHGYSKVADVLFKIYGTGVYPDATFTLRLTYGTVRGYSENGVPVLPWTTIGGAFKHAKEFGNQGVYELPRSWVRRKSSLNLNTPLNFISDLDITGGNSGSPVFNKDLEIVGVVFDSNIQGLVSDYDFNYSTDARAIAVHSAGIIEILSKVYKADRLVNELTGK